MEHTTVPANEQRLWSLIGDRMKPGADVARIDAGDLQDVYGQTWAVVFTDLTGFSRMVAEFGIIHFLQEIHEQRSLFLPIVRAYDGVLLKEEADSMLLLFARPERALEALVAMNRRSHAANHDRAPENKVLLCAGLGYGRMLRVGDRDVFGQEVNAASKLGEDIAKAGEILVTGCAREAIGEVAGIEFEPMSLAVAGSAQNFRARYSAQ